MPSPRQPNRVHLLSKKSERLQRDTFFFRPTYATLLGGLNHKLTSATPSTLYRWARLCDPRCPEFEVYPVSLRKYAIFRYSTTPMGPPISSESTIPPGDYCLEVKEGDFPVVTLPFSNLKSNLESFAELKAAAERSGSPLSESLQWYAFPAGLEGVVTARDGGRCMITGSETDVGVSWVCPPPWYRSFDFDGSNNPQALSIPSNAISMRSDLISAFHDNAFGVDVDDDCRIVIFRDIGEPSNDLLKSFRNEPAFFCRSTASGILGPDQNFLRQHFKRCILVNFVGGDITYDYPSDVVREAMYKLGVMTDDPADELAPMDDPLWHTPLGKEIFEDYMDTAMFMARDDTEDGESLENGSDNPSRTFEDEEDAPQASDHWVSP